MKIISKYKDYYDYLKGVYGEDPRLILDRRSDGNPSLFQVYQGLNVLVICGKVLEFVCFNNTIYFGVFNMYSYIRTNIYNVMNMFFIITGMLSLPLIFVFFLYWDNRCDKGGQHDYKLINEKYIPGNDIGFGITNSYTRKSYKCEKCGDQFNSIS